MDALPSLFPPLPPCPSESGLWEPSVRESRDRIATEYERIHMLLQQEGCDPLQISYHIDNVVNDSVPLLEAMELDEQVPIEWLHTGAKLLGEVVCRLKDMKLVYQGQ